MWEVLTGRRDGKVSLVREALLNIPAPFFNFTQLKASFASKGLTVHDLVVLSGIYIYINNVKSRVNNYFGHMYISTYTYIKKNKLY